MSEASLFQRLLLVQTELKVPKATWNDFGGYFYRSCEDILEAAKPLCLKHNMLLVVTDSEILALGDRFYLKATATVYDTIGNDAPISAAAFARESLDKKKLDASQLTGVASSYARKYALGGLFALDDTKDADSNEFHTETEKNKKEEKGKYICADCGKPFIDFELNGKTYTAKEQFDTCKSTSPDKKARCKSCRAKLKDKGAD